MQIEAARDRDPKRLLLGGTLSARIVVHGESEVWEGKDLLKVIVHKNPITCRLFVNP